MEDPSVQTGNVHEEEEVIVSVISDHFTHYDPLEAHADKHGSEHSPRHHHQSKSHSSGHCTAVGNPTGTCKGKDQEQRRASFEAVANPSSEGKFVSCKLFCTLPSVNFLRKFQHREELYAELCPHSPPLWPFPKLCLLFY